MFLAYLVEIFQRSLKCSGELLQLTDMNEATPTSVCGKGGHFLTLSYFPVKKSDVKAQLHSIGNKLTSIHSMNKIFM
jgi:hypothetical protein